MLSKILEKPEEYRRNVAIFATFLVSVAIISGWLLIAGYNIRQSTIAIINADNPAIEEFRNNLPSVRQDGDTIATELSKQDMAASINTLSEEKESSIWDKFLGR